MSYILFYLYLKLQKQIKSIDKLKVDSLRFKIPKDFKFPPARYRSKDLLDVFYHFPAQGGYFVSLAMANEVSHQFNGAQRESVCIF